MQKTLEFILFDLKLPDNTGSLALASGCTTSAIFDGLFW